VTQTVVEQGTSVDTLDRLAVGCAVAAANGDASDIVSERRPGVDAVVGDLPADASELVGRLQCQSEPERAGLLALIRRWQSLPPELRLAVLRVAGIDSTTE
jgi:hypothetical protein